jgi:hypothetical protein
VVPEFNGILRDGSRTVYDSQAEAIFLKVVNYIHESRIGARNVNR